MELKLMAAAAAAVLVLATGGPASAALIFSDDFNRADNSTVGNGWVETDAGHVQVIGNELELGKNGTPQATQGTNVLSTIGLTTITLDYDWRGIGTESGDTLTVYWSADGVGFNLLATHDLGSPAAFVHNSVGLGGAAEGLADIAIRFQLNANQGNDFARVDNVLLQGEREEQPPPLETAEPASLALLGLGLAGLGLARRRRVAG